MNEISAQVSPNAELSVLWNSVNFWLFSGSVSCLWAPGCKLFYSVEVLYSQSLKFSCSTRALCELDNFHLQSVWRAMLSKQAGCCPHTPSKCVQLRQPLFLSLQPVVIRIDFSYEGSCCLVGPTVLPPLPFSWTLSLRLSSSCFISPYFSIKNMLCI